MPSVESGEREREMYIYREESEKGKSGKKREIYIYREESEKGKSEKEREIYIDKYTI